jgi:hypothetical protein
MTANRKGPGQRENGRGPKAIVSVLAIALLVLVSASFILSENDDNDDENILGAGSYAPTVVTGESHTLALRNDGTVWAWGRNNQGQLGDGTDVNRQTPVQVKGEAEQDI